MEDEVLAPMLPTKCQRAQKITEAVAVFTCKDIRPYSVVENDGFRSIIKISPSKPKLFADSQTMKWSDRAKHARLLETKHRKCGMLRATDSCLTITAHYINDHSVLGCYVLQTRAVVTRHTARDLSDQGDRHVEAYKQSSNHCNWQSSEYCLALRRLWACCTLAVLYKFLI